MKKSIFITLILSSCVVTKYPPIKEDPYISYGRDVRIDAIESYKKVLSDNGVKYDERKVDSLYLLTVNPLLK